MVGGAVLGAAPGWATRATGLLIAGLASLVFGGAVGTALFLAREPQSALPWHLGLGCLAIGLLVTWACRAQSAPLLSAAQALFRAMCRTPWWMPVVVGLLLRIVSATVVEPIATSDGATYLSLAGKMLSGEGYVTAGTLAYWPPGAALILVPLLWLFGQTTWALLAFGLLAYALAVLGVLQLCKVLGLGARVVVPLWLLACWPTLVLCTGLPEKELWVAALVPWVMALAYRAWTGRAAWALLAGLVLGAAVLIQPSLQLLPFGALLLALVLGQPALRSASLTVLLLLGMLITVSPWTLRNYEVLGKPVLVSTNGGSNLYRANNELATGGYVLLGKVDVGALPELESDALGKRLAVEWIRNHPADFLRLSLTKALLFAGDDSYGAFAAFKAKRDKVPNTAYLALKLSATLPWLALWGLLAALSVQARQWSGPVLAGLMVVCLPYLYLTSLHAIFESGGRYHIPALISVFMAAVWLLVHAAPTASQGKGLLQALKFGVVGVLNTLVGLGSIFALKFFFGWSDVWANAAGFALGLGCSFALNRRWTFADRSKGAGSLVRFLQVFALAYAVNLLTLLVLVEYFGVNGYLSQVLATMVYTICSFFGSKFYAFRPEPAMVLR